MNDGNPRKPEKYLITLTALFLLIASTIIALRFSSSELGWDEAEYALSARHDWKTLWSTSNYQRHAHGPLIFFLAKAGHSLPAGLGSIETRIRLPFAILGGVAIAAIYLALRYIFHSSQISASASAALLLLSIIRLEETNIVGPHYPMLAWTVAICAIGYYTREARSWTHAILMGATFALAALTMTYWIPLAAAWGLACLTSGGKWLSADKVGVTAGWQLWLAGGIFALIVFAGWPPAFYDLTLWSDFRFYLHYAKTGHLVAVGQQAYQHAPALKSYFYWLTTLDLPLFAAGACALASTLAGATRENRPSGASLYVSAFAAVILAATLLAHVAGARNCLLFLSALCILIGIEAEKIPGRMKGLLCCLWIAWSIANVVSDKIDPERIPYLGWNGYRAFLTSNRERLKESVGAVVDGEPILRFYAIESSTDINWKIRQSPWSDILVPLPADAKYVLISELSARYLPAAQPVRSIVGTQWRTVWNYKIAHSWGLRLYQKP